VRRGKQNRGEGEKLKPVEREGCRRRAKHNRQMQTENIGKRAETDEHG